MRPCSGGEGAGQIEHRPATMRPCSGGEGAGQIEHQPSLSALLHRLESKTLMTTRQARIGRNKENYCGW
ncbi:hypothetical protein A4G28_14035 [Mycobacterium ostraviense]|uniref:Uncharacterized protein n=1 Tax=Mycobacterium ostraviense TaxID=2738409 RepID=A0A164EJK6_9MYCO|nr:hypothetical protein A4G28_14035 [Mycobacterium ostraviense]